MYMAWMVISERHQQVLLHVLFWMCAVLCLTFLFSVGMPGYRTAFVIILMMLPVHLGYYYLISKLIIPRLLYRRRSALFITAFLVTTLVSTLIYRIIEILWADPYFFESYRALVNPDFKWKKLDGSFAQQLANPQYLIHALEQSNTVVWIALVIKFVRMWYERRQMALQSELNFLKAQIHPHFLFNTLNNLYALTLDRSEEAPAVVLGLSEILRYMIYECSSDLVPLKRDIDIMQSYIALEKLRYQHRLELNVDIRGSFQGQQIAPLLMIPLVENAFKHGAGEMTEDAWINIDLELSSGRLKFKVSNGKPLGDGPQQLPEHGRIGVDNVKKRLDLIYPERYAYKVFNEEDMYVVILEIDLNGKKAVQGEQTREQHIKEFTYKAVN